MRQDSVPERPFLAQEEYCLLQQKRQKRNNVSSDNQVGAVVLIPDEFCPRSCWPRFRVTEFYPSEDGLVQKILLHILTTFTPPLNLPVHTLLLTYLSLTLVSLCVTTVVYLLSSTPNLQTNTNIYSIHLAIPCPLKIAPKS